MLAKSKEELLLKILSFSSPSSFEDEIRDFFVDRFSEKATVGKDVLGNAAAVIKGRVNGSSILLNAHLDEVGFFVTGVDSKGFIRVRVIGGIDVQEIPAAPIKIITALGPVYGVVCRKGFSDNIEEDTIGSDAIFIDIGATSKKSALNKVSVGDGVVWDTNPRKVNGKIFFSRGVDDKIGVYIITRVLDELIKKYGNKTPLTSVFGILSPLEEVGDINSVREAANKISPGAGVVVEVIESFDYPGSTDYWYDTCGEEVISIGGGPVIDVGVFTNKKLVDFVLKSAASLNITVQKTITAEDTSTTLDRLRFGSRGVPCVGIYVPIRYMHTPLSIFNVDDVEKIVKLLVKVCEDLDTADSFIP